MSIDTFQTESRSQSTGPTPSWRLGMISLLFLAGSIASGLAAWNASRQRDVLLVPDPVHANLGAVPANADVPIEFVLANQGREWIEIMSVESSCSCTAAEMETYRIPPNSSVKLKGDALDRQAGRLVLYTDRTGIPWAGSQPDIPHSAYHFCGRPVAVKLTPEPSLNLL